MEGNAMQTAKVTFKGQITIPKAVREALNIVEGDSVMLKIEGDHAILRPIKKKPLLEFFGAFLATKPYPGTESVRKQVGEKRGEELSAGVKS
jgi:antitoxin PrlF